MSEMYHINQQGVDLEELRDKHQFELQEQRRASRRRLRFKAVWCWMAQAYMVKAGKKDTMGWAVSNEDGIWWDDEDDAKHAAMLANANRVDEDCYVPVPL